MDQLQLDIDPETEDVDLLLAAGYDDLLEPERDYTGIRTRQMKLFY